MLIIIPVLALLILGAIWLLTRRTRNDSDKPDWSAEEIMRREG